MKGWRILAPCVILAVGFLAYSNSVAGPFIFDDEPAISFNPHIRHLWPIWEVFRVPVTSGIPGRPLLSLSFALNYAIGGLAPWTYHAVNLAIHLLAALVLYGLVGRLLRSKGLGLTVALVWVVHPLTTQAVTYVIQRAESLMGLWYLLTLYGLVRATPGDGSCRHHARWQLLSICACWLGMATKPVMVTAPLLALLLDRTFLAGSFRQAWRVRKGYYLFLFASWSLLVLLLSIPHETRNTAGFALATVTPLEYLATQPGVMLHYLRLALWPHPLVFDYGWPPAQHLAAIALPSIGFALLIGLTVWAWRRQPAVAFWAWWILLILAPTSSVVPIADLAFEHRMYLPLAGVAVLAVLGAHAALTRAIASARLRRQVGIGVLSLIVAGFGVLTYRRNRDYKSELRMWQDTVAKRPANFRAHNNLGVALADAGYEELGVYHLQESLRLDPSYPLAHNNLGWILVQRGKPEEALPHLQQALDARPNYVEARSNYGAALAKQGKFDEAIPHYEEALRLDPTFYRAHYNLGNALTALERQAEAIPHYHKALELNPQYHQVHAHLGIALSQLGQREEAREHLLKALEVDPEDAAAAEVLANVLFEQQQFKEAIRYYTMALERDPDSADLHNNLGVALAQDGQFDQALTHLSKAVELNPDSAEAHNNLGNVLFHQGRLEEAVAHYAEAVRLNPAYADAKANLMTAIAQQGSSSPSMATTVNGL